MYQLKPDKGVSYVEIAEGRKGEEATNFGASPIIVGERKGGKNLDVQIYAQVDES